MVIKLFPDVKPVVEHVHGNPKEVVTVQDFAPSLYDMVRTNAVSPYSSTSTRYSYPRFDSEDGEDLHDGPDYQRLAQQDIVDKTDFVTDFELKNFADAKNDEDRGELEEHSQGDQVPPKTEAETSASGSATK